MTNHIGLLQRHRIEIEGSLGQGGQGQVFRARRLTRDGRTSMPCAVKIYKIDDLVAEPSKVLLEEIATMARLCDSNHVVRLQDVIVEPAFLALVMEECEQSFADLLKQRQDERPNLGLPRAECYRIFEQIARGLSDCQADNVIHGDVKPQNMLLTRRGDAKLCDFGTARIDPSQTTLTSHGGTEGFMLPRHRERKLTKDRDVFGFALSYAYLRLGRHPFRHGDPLSADFDLTGLDEDEAQLLHPVLADEHIPHADVYNWFRQFDPAWKSLKVSAASYEVSVKLLVERVDSRRWQDGYQPDQRDIEDVRHAKQILGEQDPSLSESADHLALRSRVLTTLADLTAGSSESKELFSEAFEAINKAISLAPDSADHWAYRADLRQIKEYGGSRHLPLMFVLGPKPFDAPHAPNASLVDSWNPDSLAASLADITSAATLDPAPMILAKRALYLVLRGIKLYRDGDFPETEDMDIWVEGDKDYGQPDWVIHRDSMDDVFGEPIAELDRAIASSRNPVVTANLLLQRAWSHAGFYYGALTEVDFGSRDPYQFPKRQSDYGVPPCVWSYGKAVADIEQALSVLSSYSSDRGVPVGGTRSPLNVKEVEAIAYRRQRAYSIRNGMWIEPFWFDVISMYGSNALERSVLEVLSFWLEEPFGVHMIGTPLARDYISKHIKAFSSPTVVWKFLNDARSWRRTP